MISVHQIYFDKKSEKGLEPQFKRYFNDKKDGYFENSIIKSIYEQITSTPEEFERADKYIGISSWKQRGKTMLKGSDIISHIQKDIDSGNEKDVYIYTPTCRVKYNYQNVPEGYGANGTITGPDIWKVHKSWKDPQSGSAQVEQADILLNNSKVLPFDIFDGKWVYSHCNYWIAKKEILKEYCEQVLLPSYTFFEQPDIKNSMPNWYVHPHEGKSYNSCCFVMEGLFGAFLAHKEYSYSYICKKRIRTKKVRKINILNYEAT